MSLALCVAVIEGSGQTSVIINIIVQSLLGKLR